MTDESNRQEDNDVQRIVLAPNMGNPTELVNFAVEVEQAGYDGFFIWDHINPLFAGEQLEAHDPWVLLTAIAGATEQVRLGTGVTPVSRRRPQKLAKEIVTLDHLSGGRVTLGVGLGEPSEHEFTPFGETADQRVRAAMTDEALGLLDQLLRGKPVDHVGDHYEIHADLAPAAVQNPRPPIWIAATPPYRKGLERAARWDGVICNLRVKGDYSLVTPAELRDWAGDLLGRPGFEVVTAPHPKHAAEEYEEIGVTTIIDAAWATPNWIEEFRQHLFG